MEKSLEQQAIEASAAGRKQLAMVPLVLLSMGWMAWLIYENMLWLLQMAQAFYESYATISWLYFAGAAIMLLLADQHDCLILNKLNRPTAPEFAEELAALARKYARRLTVREWVYAAACLGTLRFDEGWSILALVFVVIIGLASFADTYSALRKLDTVTESTPEATVLSPSAMTVAARQAYNKGYAIGRAGLPSRPENEAYLAAWLAGWTEGQAMFKLLG